MEILSIWHWDWVLDFPGRGTRSRNKRIVSIRLLPDTGCGAWGRAPCSGMFRLLGTTGTGRYPPEQCRLPFIRCCELRA